MGTPLVQSKLYAPSVRRGVVSRARLSDRIRRGSQGRLTLVSAPAGFGKTTLLAELVAASSAADTPVAWLTLDANDNDPAVFWRYVLAALDRATEGGAGTNALALLDSDHGAGEAVVAGLLNDLSALSTQIVLVLDDYHVINERDLQSAMTYFVEHLPPHAHVVLGTRSDPPLPLARLRARGELIEIRAADLRFSLDEAGAYLKGVVGLDLAASHVAALEERTEGWIAALQLAALSMQGRDDIGAFIAGFAGDDRYVVDYLVEEVLHRQPDEIREFLLTTSILSRMTGALCDAVTLGASGSATLERLERANLFLVPLDDQRRWYRYHHLFADVLQARLLDERSDEVPALHGRASGWYEADGDRSEAVRHALAGQDFGRAANLIELAAPSMLRARQESTLRAWCDALPRDLFRVRPVLAVQYVGALMSTGHPEGTELLLEDAERALSDPRGIIVADGAAFDRLPGAIARYRAARALVVGDLAGTTMHASRALAASGEDDHLGRGAAAALLGLAEWSAGNLEAAYQFYADGMATFEHGGYLPDAVGGGITRADIRMTQGRLGEALLIYERGLALAMGERNAVLRGAADMHVGIADILYERNDLEGAARHLQAARALGEANGFPKHPWRLRVSMARLRRADGDVDAALELLDEAERRYVADYAPNVRPIAALRAWIHIAQGGLPAAWAWARERALSPDDELDFIREFEHIVLARLLLAQGVHDGADDVTRQAGELAERLFAAAEQGGRYGSAIQILAIQALARHALGDGPGATAALERAIAIAEPEGYVRVFLDEGRPMTTLLRLARKQPGAAEYVRHLLAAATVESEGAVRQPLVEPLSERELEVLRLLGSELDGPDIARELVVSPNTLRTHTRNIYAKLGVSSRRAAVQRAAELNLLSPTRGARPIR